MTISYQIAWSNLYISIGTNCKLAVSKKTAVQATAVFYTF